MTVHAFSRPFKLLALALVAWVGTWFYRLYAAGKIVGSGEWSATNGLIWLGLAYALMVYSLVAIYRSKTTLTSTHLTQTWIWKKHIALDQIAYAKLIRMRRLDWLVAPRLYVKTLGKFHAFYACEREMLNEFETIASRFTPA